MTSEFNLSEKIEPQRSIEGNFLWEKDVKEFIRRLKDRVGSWVAMNTEPKNEFVRLQGFEEEIDKLAGEKLI